MLIIGTMCYILAMGCICCLLFTEHFLIGFIGLSVLHIGHRLYMLLNGYRLYITFICSRLYINR